MGNAEDKKKYTLSQPHAAVMIFNYRDRFGTTKESINPQAVDQIILNTASLISVSTNKSKSDPTGRFQITLAPIKNWVSVITPGSWCIILMSRDKIEYSDTKGPGASVDPKQFKMLGRIESVRVSSNINQTTGARQTQFIVSGVDWGSIFNTHLYVDTLLRGQDANPIGQAERLIYNDLVTNAKEKFTSSGALNAITRLWGRTNEFTSKIEAVSNLVVKPVHAFTVPDEIMMYMGFTNAQGAPASKLADIVRMATGVLTGEDKYTSIDDGFAALRPDSILGGHDFWQVLTEFSNPIINEMYCDITWDNNTPELTLVKRVRPFCVHNQSDILKDNLKVGDNSSAQVSNVTDFISNFKDIKRIGIPKNEILNFDAGTNWRDKYNFIEVGYDQSLNPQALQSEIKLNSQFSDEISIGRDGFRPLMQFTKFIPVTESGTVNILGILDYKYLLKEWYFDTHKMLNGSMTIIGQSEYIAVGDNFIVDANILFPGSNFNVEHFPNKTGSYITAHIESISHSVSVDARGARHFTTTIQFVRGILTNVSGQPLSESIGGQLDQDTALLSPAEEKNKNVLTTSSANDPDDDKLKGK